MGVAPVWCSELCASCADLHKQTAAQLRFTMCAADFMYYHVSWFITFLTVVEETELMYVKHHTRCYGYSWEELMGDRLEREGEDTFRPQLQKQGGDMAGGQSCG